MITLDTIETLIKEGDSEVKAQILEYKNIIKDNELSNNPESIYMRETAKEKLDELLRLQDREPRCILKDSLTVAMYERERKGLEKEIIEIEGYAGHTEEEVLYLKALKRSVFVKNQDILIMQFLIEQLEKRDEYFASLLLLNIYQQKP